MDRLHRVFRVSDLTRQDLINEMGLSEEQVAAISDQQMETIAARMEEAYQESTYVADLREAVDQVLEQKAIDRTRVTGDFEKQFLITSLCRKDLLEAGIPRRIVESLSDADMTAIAAAMEDAYVPALFADSLQYSVERHLEKRQASTSTHEE